jgi:hypothetical protein
MNASFEKEVQSIESNVIISLIYSTTHLPIVKLPPILPWRIFVKRICIKKLEIFESIFACI